MPSTREPALQRASLQQDSLQAIRRLARGEEIVSRCAPEVVAAIESASRTEWLPVELDIALTEAVVAVLGDGAARGAAKEAMKEVFAGPFLGPLLRGVMNVFGVTPRGLVRLFGMMWPRAYRGCGQLETDVVDDHHLRCRLTAAAPEILASQAYVDGLLGSIDALCSLAGEHTDVSGTRDDRYVHIDIRWSASDEKTESATTRRRSARGRRD